MSPKHTPSTFLAQVLQRDTLLALTFTQPWATLLALWAKKIETRSWLTEHQGPLTIHAAKNFPEWAEDLCGDEPFRSILAEAGYHWKPGFKRNPWGLPVGQVVAVAWLEQVQRITPNFRVTSTERSFGNFTPGRYAWRFTNVYRLTTPIEARGSLGLWKWQPPESFWTEVQAVYEQEQAVREEGAKL